MFILFILVLTSISFYQSLRRYQGYCDLKKGTGRENYGTRLSTRQRLNIAVEQYLKNQFRDYDEIGQAEREALLPATKVENMYISNPPMYELEKIFELIPYQSKADFFKENPNCCELDLLYHDFWDRAAGSGEGTFVFTHKIRYKMPEGTYKEIISKKMTIEITNCGNSSFNGAYR